MPDDDERMGRLRQLLSDAMPARDPGVDALWAMRGIVDLTRGHGDDTMGGVRTRGLVELLRLVEGRLERIFER